MKRQRLSWAVPQTVISFWYPGRALPYYLPSLRRRKLEQRRCGERRAPSKRAATITLTRAVDDRLNEASEGDALIVESTLRNAVGQFGRAKGALVGQDTVFLTLRSPRYADVIVESKLPGGSLRAAGRVRLGPRQTYRVTGGRGRFAHARGTGAAVALVHEGQGNRRLKVYRLVLP